MSCVLYTNDGLAFHLPCQLQATSFRSFLSKFEFLQRSFACRYPSSRPMFVPKEAPKALCRVIVRIMKLFRVAMLVWPPRLAEAMPDSGICFDSIVCRSFFLTSQNYSLFLGSCSLYTCFSQMYGLRLGCLGTRESEPRQYKWSISDIPALPPDPDAGPIQHITTTGC